MGSKKRWYIKTTAAARDDFYRLDGESRTHIRKRLRVVREKENPCVGADHIHYIAPGWFSWRCGKHRIVGEVARKDFEKDGTPYFGIIYVMAVGLRKAIFKVAKRRYDQRGKYN